MDFSVWVGALVMCRLNMEMSWDIFLALVVLEVLGEGLASRKEELLRYPLST